MASSAYEIPVIRSAVGNVIVVAHPEIPKTEPLTALTASIAAGVTTLTVLDNGGFSQNDYVIIGALGQDATEIVQITGAVTAGTSLTVGATTYAHPVDTPVLKIMWNKIELSGAATSTGTKTVLNSNTVIAFQPDRPETTYFLTATEVGQNYAFFFARFNNVQTGQFSVYSDPAPIGGYGTSTVRSVKDQALAMCSVTVNDLITNQFLNAEVTNCELDVWQRRKQWSWAYTFNSILGQLVQGAYSLALPSDIADKNTNKSILFGTVKIQSRAGMTYLTKEEFDRRYINVNHTTLTVASSIGDSTLTVSNANDFQDNAFSSLTLGSGNSANYGADSTSTTGLVKIIPSSTTTASSIAAFVSKTGTPADNLTIEVQTDSSNSPSGTAITNGVSNTVAGSSLTTTLTSTTFNFASSFTINAGVTYWLVFKRSGANDSSNYYSYGLSSAQTLAIGSDTVTYLAKTASTFRGCTGLLVAHANAADVWQNASFGEPFAWTTYGGTIYFDTPVDATFANDNIYIDYYRKPTAVTTDNATLNIPDVVVYHYYLAWKILLRKNGGIQTPEIDAMKERFDIRVDRLVKLERSGQRRSMMPRLNRIKYVDEEFTQTSTPTVQ